jgi:hypothetical protein
MANEPRGVGRLLRRAAPEPFHTEDYYDEPDFKSWSSKLDAFVPTETDEPASAPAPAVAEAPVAVIAAPRGPTLNDTLNEVIAFDGAMSIALVDGDTGLILGNAGITEDLELAAAGASVMLRARRATVTTLGLDDEVEDLLVTLSTQLQIIRPLTHNPKIFLYMIVDKERSSLAMARFKASEAGDKLTI